MKRFKKFAAMVLALAMCFALAISASAEGSCTITIENAVAGQTYTAYKLFEVEKSTDGSAVTYYVNAVNNANPLADLTNAGVVFTESADGTRYNVDTINKDTAKTLATYVNTHLSELNLTKADYTTAPEAPVAAATTTVTLSVDPGYYFIDSSLGAVCALTDAGENFTEIEKNTQPTITKKIVDGEDAVASTSRKIGDIVTFQLTVSVATTSPDTTYKVVDTMTDGLELVETSIKINGVDATDNDTNYTLTTGTQTFTIEFTNDYVKRYTSETITIAYDAKITKSAVQTGEDGNLVIKALNNKVVLYYGDTYTVGTGDTEVNIYNGNINIYKYDAKDDTEGSKTPLVATFVLMNDQSKYLIADWNTNDADASDWTDDLTQALHITTQDDGTASVEGLAYGTYYLREITAPQGYNLLATDVEITISGTTVTTLNLTENVPNSTGTTLPSTGGIGTTIFYVVGGILVLGAGIVLVTKKRMANR